MNIDKIRAILTVPRADEDGSGDPVYWFPPAGLRADRSARVSAKSVAEQFLAALKAAIEPIEEEMKRIEQRVVGCQNFSHKDNRHKWKWCPECGGLLNESI
jgi:hypothetical protein